MTTAGQPTGYFNQTYAVEFTVEGTLDGTTIQPSVLDSPPSGISSSDPQQLLRYTVEDLGLIDPDYMVPVSADDRRGVRGNRLVTYIWIAGPNAGAANAAVDVVDSVDGTPVVQEAIGTFVGTTEFYYRGIFVPQGSMIRVRGMTGTAADPIKVRFHVEYLNNAATVARALEIVGRIAGANLLIQRGDLLTHDGIDDVRFPVGVNGNTLLADSGQPTGLRWGLFAHNLGGAAHQACTLAQLNALINDATLPALAGQLGGTAASPDVRGIRETGGPTLLTLGAIADTELLVRAGGTVVGAARDTLQSVTGRGNVTDQCLSFGVLNPPAAYGIYGGLGFVLLYMGGTIHYKFKNSASGFYPGYSGRNLGAPVTYPWGTGHIQAHVGGVQDIGDASDTIGDVYEVYITRGAGVNNATLSTAVAGRRVRVHVSGAGGGTVNLVSAAGDRINGGAVPTTLALSNGIHNVSAKDATDWFSYGPVALST